MSERIEHNDGWRRSVAMAVAGAAVVAGLSSCSTKSEGPLLSPQDIQTEQYDTRLLLPCARHPNARLQLPRFAVLGDQVHAYMAGPSKEPQDQLVVKVLNAEDSDVMLQPNEDSQWQPEAPITKLKRPKGVRVVWPDKDFSLDLHVVTKRHRQYVDIQGSCSNARH